MCWFSLSVLEIFQQQPKSPKENFSDFDLHFHHRAKPFTCEITEIFWTEGKYFSVYWNSVDFIEIPLKVKTNCCLIPSTECNEAPRLWFRLKCIHLPKYRVQFNFVQARTHSQVQLPKIQLPNLLCDKRTSNIWIDEDVQLPSQKDSTLTTLNTTGAPRRVHQKNAISICLFIFIKASGKSRNRNWVLTDLKIVPRMRGHRPPRQRRHDPLVELRCRPARRLLRGGGGTRRFLLAHLAACLPRWTHISDLGRRANPLTGWWNSTHVRNITSHSS